MALVDDDIGDSAEKTRCGDFPQTRALPYFDDAPSFLLAMKKRGNVVVIAYPAPIFSILEFYQE